MHIKIGSRGSKLALAQSRMVMQRLQEHYPMHTYEIVIIQTKGDKIQNQALNKIGDKGLFIKEIEIELLNETIDMAVHSMKDMPSTSEELFAFSKLWKREENSDVLITRENESFDGKGIIGTGSLRRQVQLKKLYPEAKIEGIRGNVDSRIAKLDRGEYDAIVMAKAGLKRLDLTHRISYEFKLDELIPAPAQGCLSLQYLTKRNDIKVLLDALSDAETDECVNAERSFLARMNGSCHVCVGASVKKDKKGYCVHALFGECEEDVKTYHAHGEHLDVLMEEAIAYCGVK